MAIRFVSSDITSVGGDGFVNASEASPIGFQITGTGVYESTDPTAEPSRSGDIDFHQRHYSDCERSYHQLCQRRWQQDVLRGR